MYMSYIVSSNLTEKGRGKDEDLCFFDGGEASLHMVICNKIKVIILKFPMHAFISAKIGSKNTTTRDAKRSFFLLLTFIG